MTHTILLFNNKHWQFIIFLVKNCWLVNWTIYSLSYSLFCYLNIFQFLCICRRNKTIQSCVLHKLKLALDYIRCNWHKVFRLPLSLVQEWPFVARVFSLGFHGEREEGRGTVRQMFSLQPSVEITHVLWAAALHLPLEECYFTGRTYREKARCLPSTFLTMRLLTSGRNVVMWCNSEALIFLF